jgi:hypothetical protein
MSIKKLIWVLAAISPVLLSACGDGWVVQPYKGTPYNGRGLDDDSRTAGYGVEYVRAKMMPAKGPDTKSVTPTPAQVADPVYNKAQRK